jgi:hypothetical protein
MPPSKRANTRWRHDYWQSVIYGPQCWPVYSSNRRVCVFISQKIYNFLIVFSPLSQPSRSITQFLLIKSWNNSPIYQHIYHPQHALSISNISFLSTLINSSSLSKTHCILFSFFFVISLFHGIVPHLILQNLYLFESHALRSSAITSQETPSTLQALWTTPNFLHPPSPVAHGRTCNEVEKGRGNARST